MVGSRERKRPLFAAAELQKAAIKSAGLGGKPVVMPVVERAARAAGITPTSTTLKLTLEDPKSAIREFRGGDIDDAPCLEKTLALVERDLPKLVERANAWAVGDMEALQRLPYESAAAACMEVVTQRLAAMAATATCGSGVGTTGCPLPKPHCGRTDRRLPCCLLTGCWPLTAT